MKIDDYPPSGFGRARTTGGRHGYVAYFPRKIPRRVDLPSATLAVLADAESALGQLSAIEKFVPNPDLFSRPYLLREAVYSTRIEGTRTSFGEVLGSAGGGEIPNADVEEVVNYVEAMNWAISQAERLPLSVRLVREIHKRLMSGVRGRDLAPGELRRTQNWIGPPGSTVESAPFVPPPPEELADLLGDWERFAHEDGEMPLLVQNALLHAQFETIHPFLDGNGRLGRLLLVLFLIQRGRLRAPVLYLSAYIEANRDAYYDALERTRSKGDPVPWIEMFLTAVKTQALDAVDRAEQIITIRDSYLEAAARTGSSNAVALVDLICENPIVTTKAIEDRLGVTRPTALRLLTRMEEQGALSEGEQGPRGQRRYVARQMLGALSGGGV